MTAFALYALRMQRRCFAGVSFTKSGFAKAVHKYTVIVTLKSSIRFMEAENTLSQK